MYIDDYDRAQLLGDNFNECGGIMYENKGQAAVVLEIGNRFFYRFDKRGYVQTAWSLAGAQFFDTRSEDKISAVEQKLEGKGKQWCRRNVIIPDILKADKRTSCLTTQQTGGANIAAVTPAGTTCGDRTVKLPATR